MTHKYSDNPLFDPISDGPIFPDLNTGFEKAGTDDQLTNDIFGIRPIRKTHIDVTKRVHQHKINKRR